MKVVIHRIPELINGLVETKTVVAFTGFQTALLLIYARWTAQMLSMLIATAAAISKGGIQRLIIGSQSVENKMLSNR